MRSSDDRHRVIGDRQENLNVAFGSLSACRNLINRPAAPKCKADDRKNLAATERHQAAFAHEAVSQRARNTMSRQAENGPEADVIDAV